MGVEVHLRCRDGEQVVLSPEEARGIVARLFRDGTTFPGSISLGAQINAALRSAVSTVELTNFESRALHRVLNSQAA